LRQLEIDSVFAERFYSLVLGIEDLHGHWLFIYFTECAFKQEGMDLIWPFIKQYWQSDVIAPISSKGYNFLSSAVLLNSKDLVQFAFDFGADPNQLLGNTPIFFRVMAIRNKALIDCFLNHPKININQEPIDFFMYAISEGNEVAVNCLIKSTHEINRHKRTTNGSTALHLAVHAQDETMIYYAVNAGFSLDDRDNEGKSPLIYLIWTSESSFLKPFLSYCLKHHKLDFMKSPASICYLRYAVAKQNLNVIQMITSLLGQDKEVLSYLMTVPYIFRQEETNLIRQAVSRMKPNILTFLCLFKPKAQPFDLIFKDILVWYKLSSQDYQRKFLEFDQAVLRNLLKQMDVISPSQRLSIGALSDFLKTIDELRERHLDFLDLFFEYNLMPDLSNSFKMHEVIVKALFASELDVDTTDAIDKTIYSFFIPFIKHLVQKSGFNLNAQNSEGNTLLHLIFDSINSYSRLPIRLICLLIEKGADLFVCNKTGDFPLRPCHLSRKNFQLCKIGLSTINVHIDDYFNKVDELKKTTTSQFPGGFFSTHVQVNSELSSLFNLKN
jgi:ankyrin repeat protein